MPTANPGEPGPFDHDGHAGYVMGGHMIGCRDCHHVPTDMVSSGLPRPDHCFDCHRRESPFDMLDGLAGTRDSFAFDHDFHKRYTRGGNRLRCNDCHPGGARPGPLPVPGSCHGCHEESPPYNLRPS